MSDRSHQPHTDEEAGHLLGGMAILLIVGSLLGIGYNMLGMQARRPWGLAWIAEDKVAALADMEPIVAVDPPAEQYYTDISDPLAVPQLVTGTLPEIPAIGRPVPMELGAVVQFIDADAALLVDARDRDQYAEGHIPGAISLPYDEAITDPALLEGLETGGRPIIAYCGSGCEVSLSLAEELIFAGHTRVAVLNGGFPDWVAAGHPVAEGD